jgi:hypothetical protein
LTGARRFGDDAGLCQERSRGDTSALLAVVAAHLAKGNRMLTRLASTLLVLAVLVLGGACQRATPPGESAPPERTQAAREALTPGAGSVGDCNGNPSRCTMVMIEAGDRYTVALKSDGTVWAWGSNTAGQLGDGTTTRRTAPVQVKGSGGTGTLSDIVAVAAGGLHTIALKTDGTVWTWGYNGEGQLGDGSTTNQTAPIQVSTLRTSSPCRRATGTPWP